MPPQVQQGVEPAGGILLDPAWRELLFGSDGLGRRLGPVLLGRPGAQQRGQNQADDNQDRHFLRNLTQDNLLLPSLEFDSPGLLGGGLTNLAERQNNFLVRQARSLRDGEGD